MFGTSRLSEWQLDICSSSISAWTAPGGHGIVAAMTDTGTGTSADPSIDADRLRAQLHLSQFPRAATYDPQWQVDTAMGPNPLWFAEALSQVMALEPGMRVLDLGCGKGATSVFFAQQFDVTVWAVELWTPVTEVWRTVRDAGASDTVHPLHADARELPFPEEYFDAIVSVDSYHYFGTDDLYLPYLAPFLRPGGQLGIVVPGLTHEINGQVPDHLHHWQPDFHAFHSPHWWSRHLTNSGTVTVTHADLVPDGWKHWQRWEAQGTRTAPESWREQCAHQADDLARDAGRTYGFPRLLAHRTTT
jgi:cyclopropane fatty-acyl-phospholipid synthase-like methyltransferase